MTPEVAGHAPQPPGPGGHPPAAADPAAPGAAAGARVAGPAAGAEAAAPARDTGAAPAHPDSVVEPHVRVDARALESALINLRKRIGAVPLLFEAPNVAEAKAEPGQAAQPGR